LAVSAVGGRLAAGQQTTAATKLLAGLDSPGTRRVRGLIFLEHQGLGLGLQDWVDRIQHSIPITGENAKHAIRMVPGDDV